MTKALYFPEYEDHGEQTPWVGDAVIPLPEGGKALFSQAHGCSVAQLRLSTSGSTVGILLEASEGGRFFMMSPKAAREIAISLNHVADEVDNERPS